MARQEADGRLRTAFLILTWPLVPDLATQLEKTDPAILNSTLQAMVRCIREGARAFFVDLRDPRPLIERSLRVQWHREEAHAKASGDVPYTSVKFSALLRDASAGTSGASSMAGSANNEAETVDRKSAADNVQSAPPAAPAPASSTEAAPSISRAGDAADAEPSASSGRDARRAGATAGAAKSLSLAAASAAATETSPLPNSAANPAIRSPLAAAAVPAPAPGTLSGPGSGRRGGASSSAPEPPASSDRAPQTVLRPNVLGDAGLRPGAASAGAASGADRVAASHAAAANAVATEEMLAIRQKLNDIAAQAVMLRAERDSLSKALQFREREMEVSEQRAEHRQLTPRGATAVCHSRACVFALSRAGHARASERIGERGQGRARWAAPAQSIRCRRVAGRGRRRQSRHG